MSIKDYIIIFEKHSSFSRKRSKKHIVNSAKPTLRVWGACPQQTSTVSGFLLFQKRSKSVSSASQKIMGCPNLGEADPGGLGACPQK
jgi:hypothetical protein